MPFTHLYWYHRLWWRNGGEPPSSFLASRSSSASVPLQRRLLIFSSIKIPRFSISNTLKKTLTVLAPQILLFLILIAYNIKHASNEQYVLFCKELQ